MDALKRAIAAEARAVAAEEEVRQTKEALVLLEAENARLRSTLQAISELAICPIQQGVFNDPVVASDGYSYERRAIFEWQRRTGPFTSPLTREPLRLLQYRNHFARQVLLCLSQAGILKVDELLPVDEGLVTPPFDDDDDLEEISIASTDLGEVGGANSPVLMSGRGQLQQAIVQQNENHALYLLRMSSSPRGLNDVETGHTVLHLAIGFGFQEVALRILARPDFVCVNIKDPTNSTGLHWAAGRGYIGVCRAILNREDFEQLHAINDLGFSALQVARGVGHQELVELLEQAQNALECFTI